RARTRPPPGRTRSPRASSVPRTRCARRAHAVPARARRTAPRSRGARRRRSRASHPASCPARCSWACASLWPTANERQKGLPGDSVKLRAQLGLDAAQARTDRQHGREQPEDEAGRQLKVREGARARRGREGLAAEILAHLLLDLREPDQLRPQQIEGRADLFVVGRLAAGGELREQARLQTTIGRQLPLELVEELALRVDEARPVDLRDGRGDARLEPPELVMDLVHVELPVPSQMLLEDEAAPVALISAMKERR